MKTSLTKVIENKKKLKNQLSELKSKYILIIYKGFTKNQSSKKIHKELFDATINHKKVGKFTSDNLLKTAVIMVDRMKSKFNAGLLDTTKSKYGSVLGSRVSNSILMSVVAFDLINNLDVEKKLSKDINSIANELEGKEKENAIKNNLEGNRNLENPKIFYLASSHRDSATDHKDYQGKIYVDKYWEEVVKDKELKDKIKKFINNNNILTVQWVTEGPVWFITRPNCRHYFKVITTNEAISFSTGALLKINKMETAIGDRQYLQTIKHKTKKEWYQDLRNAELLLEKYKERLKLHQEMYAIEKNPILQHAIKKDKMLIAKWEKYINEHKG